MGSGNHKSLTFNGGIAKFKPFDRMSFSLSIISREEKSNTTASGSKELLWSCFTLRRKGFGLVRVDVDQVFSNFRDQKRVPKIHKSPFLLDQFFPRATTIHTSLPILYSTLNSSTTRSLIITDSFSFVQELLNSDIDSSNVVMASFDVTSLFTNIPVNETIDIICNSLFSNCQFFNGLDPL